ncbi:hypothetical protein PGB90_010423 [Kerria lacca]
MSLLKCFGYKHSSQEKEIRSLDLTSSDLNEVPMFIITHERTLEFLSLASNHIQDLPLPLFHCQNLNTLILSDNELYLLPSAIIDVLPTEILHCSRLNFANFNHCNLRFLPIILKNLEHLVTLKVEHNNLEYLHESISGLVNLEELFLTNNKLKYLPVSIGLLRKLIILHLDENMISELPPEIGSCISLKVLTLRSNRLFCIPDEIGHLLKLSVLSLTDNSLRYLPLSILKLRNLTALWLSHNQGKPLISLQHSFDPQLSKRILTCYLLPQQKNCRRSEKTRNEYVDSKISERRRSFIKFEIDPETVSGNKLTRIPTPHPKKLKELASITRSSEKRNYVNPFQIANYEYEYKNEQKFQRHDYHSSSDSGFSVQKLKLDDDVT